MTSLKDRLDAQVSLLIQIQDSFCDAMRKVDQGNVVGEADNARKLVVELHFLSTSADILL